MFARRLHFNDLTRREFCALAGGGITALALDAGCRLSSGSEIFNNGRITARPRAGAKTTATGRVMLGVAPGDNDAILQLPKTVGLSPLPLLVMLHGATQSADEMFWYLGSAHDEAGVAVFAPKSRDTTWDAIRGSFGSDVELINRGLERVFNSVAVDPARIAIGGFSDGATYAISLGMVNGDLFNRVVAFSPGFIIEAQPLGKPRFYISHGTRDHILPIDNCGRRVVAALKARGYEVTFREFNGDHEIPAAVAREGLSWVAAAGSATPSQ